MTTACIVLVLFWNSSVCFRSARSWRRWSRRWRKKAAACLTEVRWIWSQCSGLTPALPQCWPLLFFFFFCSAGGENQAEPYEAEAGDHSDGRADRRGGAHAASGQTQGEVQHDARHARHQHPRARRRALRLAPLPRPEKPGEVRLLWEDLKCSGSGSWKMSSHLFITNMFFYFL